MGKASRDKGARFEREIVKLLQDKSFAGERVPLSGAAGGSFSGDIEFPLLGKEWRGECKVRARGFTQIYQWLGENNCLFVKADRREPLIVLKLDDFLNIALLAEFRKG